LKPLPRRHVIRASAGAALGMASMTGRLGRAVQAPAQARAEETIVFVCLRGGADGLSIIVPHADRSYYAARPRTAIKRPGGGPGSAIDLDGKFGLHPSLATFKPLYDQGMLGVVVGVGMPELTRSHAVARRTIDLAIVRALQGSKPAVFEGSFADQLAKLAAQIGAGQAPAAVQVESLGWDTHAAQGDGSSGILAARLSDLADSLSSFRRSLGNHARRVLVVVLTEFGRSLVETPMGGTDDGHASVMLLLHGQPTWSRVLGRWPGLGCESLSAGRYVQPTSDIGRVLVDIARGVWPK
jgi:uncharacterized protein (DUF1501 family)